MMEAVVFQMTWPGSPTIYYGDEAGLCGWTDPDNRRTFPWGSEDKNLLGLHKALIAMRQELPVLKHGSVEFLWNEYGVLSFARWNNAEQMAIAINNNNEPKKINMPVWKMGVLNGKMKCLLSTANGTATDGGPEYTVKNGRVSIEIPAYGSMVLAAL
jgi:alpha-glucosidase